MKRFQHGSRAIGIGRRLVPWLATAALFALLSPGIQGAPAESEDEADRRPEESEEAEPERGEGAAPSTEVFLPTEEISEDYAAPFPVDI